MSECFKCGVSGDKARLYDAISEHGIVKICSVCNSVEKLPLIQRATTEQIKQSERQQTVREKIAGFRGGLALSREPTLRDLVDKKFKENVSKDIQPRPDLIENFNWIIQRVRRMKHISREQFAKDLGESETSIKMLEEGVLPENDNRLISKVESYLGIILRKPGVLINPPKELPKEQRILSFDEQTAKKLKISDLREIKKRRGEEDLNSYVETWGDAERERKPSEESNSEEKKENVNFDISEGEIDEFF